MLRAVLLLLDGGVELCGWTFDDSTHVILYGVCMMFRHQADSLILFGIEVGLERQSWWLEALSYTLNKPKEFSHYRTMVVEDGVG